MIYYNSNTINDWNFGDDNIIKVYKHGAVVFYKFDSEQGGYKVCYAVVADITQYSETEFEDVYDKATEKWYKLNNLNQYEQYGIYGSGRTSCEGSTSRLPQGYTEVEYIENTSTAYIDTGFKPNQDTRITLTAQTVTSQASGKLIGSGGFNKTNTMQFCYEPSSTGSLVVSWGTVAGWTTYSSCIGDYNVHTYDWNKNEFYRDDTLVGSVTYANFQCTDNLGIFRHIQAGDSPSAAAYFKGKIFNLKIFDNGTLVRDFVPAKRDSDDKYGMYDLVTDTFYLSPNNVDFIGGDPVTPTDCVTTYNGKLTIDNGYEYEWNGSSWVNLGEVSGSSITIKSPEYIEKNSSHTGYCELLETFTEDTKIIMKHRQTVAAGASIIGDYYNNDNDDWRVFFASSTLYYDFITQRKSVSKRMPMSVAEEWEIGNYYIKNTATGSYYINGTQQTFSTRPNQMYLYYLGGFGNVSDYGQVYYIKIYRGETLVRDFIPWTDMNGNYGLYDKVENELVHTIGNMTASTVINDVTIGSEVYPKYYSEKSEPLDNLTFNTMEDAQAYAKANCVYDGMHATIGADRYYFDSTDENGWVKILEYYKFEDVTPGGTSGWTISGSATYNPDSSYYDDFDLETTSTSSSYKIAKVTIYGYDHFTYYLRTSGYSNYCYAVATNVDELSTDPTNMSYSSNSAITNTYNFYKSAGSAVNLSNYRRITYNNLDKTVEHTFYVVFYGRTYSSYVGNATILIPKEQTNENWEQVAFSASSNVASAQKNLYIDGNYSTNGGTQYWYYRWMVGLPSGSHSSYTNYSNYNYCPSVTTGYTFTSVAGEQRQVNFTYDNTSSKTLSFRLTDGNGNVLTPSDTVYYNMTYYNSCSVSSSSSNVTFPRSQSVKVGGRFRFANSSNRHYIYGYSPSISLNTDYYVNNYNTYFDIPYTKLSEEAVTITYTTYDPSDVETPAFKTDITYPYNGNSISSTTSTSYDVPYTYPYTVSQTSDKFSATSQTYTAGQSSRTISFVLYPNNREFATVTDLEAYQYAWEGMKASVNGTNYQYKNGEWVEQAYTQYEYIRTQNAERIYYDFITDFKPTKSHTIEVKVEFVDRSIDWGHLVSWYDGTKSHGFSFQTVTSSYQAIVRAGGDNGISYRPTIGANSPTVFTLPLNVMKGTYSINGGSSQEMQYNWSDMFLPANTGMCFFGQGTTSRGKAAVAKMYYVKVYDGNGNLVKHYVPSDNNGTPCFYEIVDGEYIMDTYTGSNHGTLTLGPAI